jgi:hypothetical protein
MDAVLVIRNNSTHCVTRRPACWYDVAEVQALLQDWTADSSSSLMSCTPVELIALQRALLKACCYIWTGLSTFTFAVVVML